jgi:putative transposase
MTGKYDGEFKLEAIRLAAEEGARATEVERRLGLSQGMISRWKRQLHSEGSEAFPGKGHLSASDEQVRALSGRPKITRALWAEDWKVSENRVAKRMKTMGLRSIVRRRFRVTTQSKHAFPVAPNRLGRRFQVDAPNRVWVSDITYIRLQQGWVYLAVFIDLFSRQVVGWALSKALDHGLVLKTLERARRNRNPPRSLMIHSDRGIQYACTGFWQ